MNAAVSYVLYLKKTFWPVDLAIFYPYQQALPFWQFLGALIILLLISVIAIIYIRKRPFLFVGWFWYLGTLIPVIGLVQVGRQAMADRYTYLPSIGIGIILVWGLISLLPKEKLQKIILLPLTITVIILLSVLTWRQCGYWKNSVTLFNHAINVTTDNYLAYNYVGLALAAQGKYSEAETKYKSALEINPYYELAHANLGIALTSQGKNKEAIDHYLAVLEMKKDDDVAYANLGVALAAEGKNDEAIIEYRKALQINPDNDNAHYNLANLFARLNKSDEAISHYLEAVRINPGNVEAISNLGVNLEMKRQHEEAIKYYKMALSIKPNDARLYFNLGVAYGNSNNLSEAINNFRRAIDLDPEFKEAHAALQHAMLLQKKNNN
jgi:tetratricopeptide (TPR) repeat protein